MLRPNQRRAYGLGWGASMRIILGTGGWVPLARNSAIGPFGAASSRLMNAARPAMLQGPATGRPVSGRKYIMAWKTPRIVVVSLALEINSYACAEIG